MYVRMCVYAYNRTKRTLCAGDESVHVYVHVCMYLCMHVFICVCMCIHSTEQRARFVQDKNSARIRREFGMLHMIYTYIHLHAFAHIYRGRLHTPPSHTCWHISSRSHVLAMVSFTYIPARMHTYIHTHAGTSPPDRVNYTYIPACMHAYMRTCLRIICRALHYCPGLLHTYIHTYTHTYQHRCMHVCMYVHVRACMYMNVCKCNLL